MNQTFLVLGVGFVLLGVIAAGSGRRKPGASLPEGGKRAASPLGTIGMFFLGLGIVLAIIGI